MEKPIREKIKVFKTESTGKKVINPEFINFMKREKIDELIVLALVGVAGRGKSTLGSILVSQIERLNSKNYDKRPVFETSRGLISMTQGVDCLDEMLKLPGTNKGLLILDVQGVDSILDKNENINNLNILKNFYIAMISSSIVMYFIDSNRILQNEMNNIKYFTKYIEEIKKLQFTMPALIMFKNRVEADYKFEQNEIEEYKKLLPNCNHLYFKYGPKYPLINNSNLNFIDDNILDFFSPIVNDLLNIFILHPKSISNLAVSTDGFLKFLSDVIDEINNVNSEKKLSYIKNSSQIIIEEQLKLQYKKIKNDYIEFFNNLESKFNYCHNNFSKQIIEQIMKSRDDFKINKQIINVALKHSNERKYELYCNQLEEIIKHRSFRLDRLIKVYEHKEFKKQLELENISKNKNLNVLNVNFEKIQLEIIDNQNNNYLSNEIEKLGDIIESNKLEKENKEKIIANLNNNLNQIKYISEKYEEIEKIKNYSESISENIENIRNNIEKIETDIFNEKNKIEELKYKDERISKNNDESNLTDKTKKLDKMHEENLELKEKYNKGKNECENIKIIYENSNIILEEKYKMKEEKQDILSNLKKDISNLNLKKEILLLKENNLNKKEYLQNLNDLKIEKLKRTREKEELKKKESILKEDLDNIKKQLKEIISEEEKKFFIKMEKNIEHYKKVLTEEKEKQGYSGSVEIRLEEMNDDLLNLQNKEKIIKENINDKEKDLELLKQKRDEIHDKLRDYYQLEVKCKRIKNELDDNDHHFDLIQIEKEKELLQREIHGYDELIRKKRLENEKIEKVIKEYEIKLNDESKSLEIDELKLKKDNLETFYNKLKLTLEDLKKKVEFKSLSNEKINDFFNKIINSIHVYGKFKQMHEDYLISFSNLLYKIINTDEEEIEKILKHSKIPTQLLIYFPDCKDIIKKIINFDTNIEINYDDLNYSENSIDKYEYKSLITKINQIEIDEKNNQSTNFIDTQPYTNNYVKIPLEFPLLSKYIWKSSVLMMENPIENLFNTIEENDRVAVSCKKTDSAIDRIMEILSGSYLDDQDLIKNLVFHPKIFKLLNSFYLSSSNRVFKNYFNKFAHIFELPFIINYQGESYVTNEIINFVESSYLGLTGSTILCCAIPLFYLKDKTEINLNDLIEQKTTLINEYFKIQFVTKSRILISQFKLLKNYVKNRDILLVNYNKIVDTDIDNFIKAFDILIVFIMCNRDNEFIEMYKNNEELLKNKLIICVRIEINDRVVSDDVNIEELVDSNKNRLITDTIIYKESTSFNKKIFKNEKFIEKLNNFGCDYIKVQAWVNILESISSGKESISDSFATLHKIINSDNKQEEKYKYKSLYEKKICENETSDTLENKYIISELNKTDHGLNCYVVKMVDFLFHFEEIFPVNRILCKIYNVDLQLLIKELFYLNHFINEHNYCEVSFRKLISIFINYLEPFPIVDIKLKKFFLSNNKKAFKDFLSAKTSVLSLVGNCEFIETTLTNIFHFSTRKFEFSDTISGILVNNSESTYLLILIYTCEICNPDEIFIQYLKKVSNLYMDKNSSDLLINIYNECIENSNRFLTFNNWIDSSFDRFTELFYLKNNIKLIKNSTETILNVHENNLKKIENIITSNIVEKIQIFETSISNNLTQEYTNLMINIQNELVQLVKIYSPLKTEFDFSKYLENECIKNEPSIINLIESCKIKEDNLVRSLIFSAQSTILNDYLMNIETVIVNDTINKESSSKQSIQNSIDSSKRIFDCNFLKNMFSSILNHLTIDISENFFKLLMENNDLQMNDIIKNNFLFVEMSTNNFNLCKNKNNNKYFYKSNILKDWLYVKIPIKSIKIKKDAIVDEIKSITNINESISATSYFKKQCLIDYESLLKHFISKLNSELKSIGYSMMQEDFNFQLINQLKLVQQCSAESINVVMDNIQIHDYMEFSSYIKAKLLINGLNLKYFDVSISKIPSLDVAFREAIGIFEKNVSEKNNKDKEIEWFLYESENELLSLNEINIININEIFTEPNKILNFSELLNDVDKILMVVFGIIDNQNLEEFFLHFENIFRNSDYSEILIHSQSLRILEPNLLENVAKEINKIVNLLDDGYHSFNLKLTNNFKSYLFHHVSHKIMKISKIIIESKLMTTIENVFSKLRKSTPSSNLFSKNFTYNNHNQKDFIILLADEVIENVKESIKTKVIEDFTHKIKQEAKKIFESTPNIKSKINSIENKMLSELELSDRDKYFYKDFVLFNNYQISYSKKVKKLENVIDTEITNYTDVYQERLKRRLEKIGSIVKKLKRNLKLNKYKNFEDLNDGINPEKAKELFNFSKEFIISSLINDKEFLDPEINSNNKVNKTEGLIYNRDDFLDELLSHFNTPETFNIILLEKPQFEQKDIVLDILSPYIGCISRCPCCNRKCEEVHISKSKSEVIHRAKFHNFRIVKGYRTLLNDPSLLTCNEITGDSIINGKKWNEIRNDILKEERWDCSSEYTTQEIEDRIKVLNKIWILFGQEIWNKYYKDENTRFNEISYEDFYLRNVQTLNVLLLYDESFPIEKLIKNEIQPSLEISKMLKFNLIFTVGVFGANVKKSEFGESVEIKIKAKPFDYEIFQSNIYNTINLSKPLIKDPISLTSEINRFLIYQKHEKTLIIICLENEYDLNFEINTDCHFEKIILTCNPGLKDTLIKLKNLQEMLIRKKISTSFENQIKLEELSSMTVEIVNL